MMYQNDFFKTKTGKMSRSQQQLHYKTSVDHQASYGIIEEFGSNISLPHPQSGRYISLLHHTNQVLGQKRNIK